jgi:anti-sigma factor RsiW
MNMAICKECRREFEEHLVECPRCGTVLASEGFMGESLPPRSAGVPLAPTEVGPSAPTAAPDREGRGAPLEVSRLGLNRTVRVTAIFVVLVLAAVAGGILVYWLITSSESVLSEIVLNDRIMSSETLANAPEIGNTP